MITYLLVYLCTSKALDDCQIFVYDQYEGPFATMDCRAQTAPTLELLRAQGAKNIIVRCEQESTI